MVYLLHMISTSHSHTFLIDNHVRLRSSQNAFYTVSVYDLQYDLHLRLTAKPHIHMICGIFHTEVNTHLLLCSTHNLLINRQNGLNFCIQVEYFSPPDTMMTSAFLKLILRPLIDYLSNVTLVGCNEETLLDFTAF